MRKRIVVVMLVSAGMLLGCNNKNKSQPVKQATIEFRKDAEIILIKANGDTLEKLNVEIADNDYARETGLMYRESMDANQGMLFVFPNEQERGFFMKNTLIPLDLVYFKADSTVVSIHNDAQPLSETTLPSKGFAQFVLEVNAGLIHQWGFEVGDRFSILEEVQ